MTARGRQAEARLGSPWVKRLYNLFALVREDLARYGEQETDKSVQRPKRPCDPRSAVVAEPISGHPKAARDGQAKTGHLR